MLVFSLLYGSLKNLSQKLSYCIFEKHEFLRLCMIIGYARVSTAAAKDQNLDLQIEALKKVGCKKMFK
ncbi:recombinase family protein [Dyadobacter sp. NIV53]|uniref:recombinase family protein n=1 Tax=Dyadobacter sp. NIV53 TaxID=2861765 RepID=UPI0038D4448B